jgi:preprotein translocase subunit SecD
VALIRIHIESESSAAGPTKSITVLRSAPVTINITTDPILTEADVLAARVIDSPGGGFAIELKFQETAGWKLEQYTAINPGKHLVIFGQWSDKVADGRWLAAPYIARRMGGDTLVFSPDASHEEAEQLVKGLNALARKNAEPKSKE